MKKKNHRLCDPLQKYLPYALFLALAGLFVVTRFWQLTTIPAGIYADEAATAYSAWSLANYGVDRYLDSWPVYLKNFWGGQSALYPYLCVLLFQFFDYSLWMTRLPSVLFSLLTLIFGMKICRKLYPNHKYLPYLCGLIMVVSPYFIMASRIGLDCNLMLGMSTIFLYFFILAIKNNTNSSYFLAGLTGGLVLYTYALSYLILPLFLLLTLFYLIITRRFYLRKWIIMGIPMGILAFPLLLVQYVNAFDKPEMKLGIFTITKMETYRSSDITGFTLKNLLVCLKTIFIYDDNPHNSIPGYMNLYVITVLLFIIGLFCILKKLVRSIRTRQIDYLVFPLLWFICPILLQSFIVSVTTNKVNSIFFVTVLVAMEGVCALFRVLKKFSPKLIMTALAFAYLLCFLRFGSYYYMGSYTRDYYPMKDFDITVTEALDFLEDHPEYQNKGTYMSGTKLYYALSVLQSPYEMQLTWEAESRPSTDANGYYTCGTLPEIDPNYNYIVRDIYPEYADSLRKMGFAENRYVGYSLFYMK